MRVCILTTSFPRVPGHHQAPYILGAARSLQELGHTVRVIALHEPGLPETQSWDGLEIVRVRYAPDWLEIAHRDAGGLPQLWRNNPLGRSVVMPILVALAAAVGRHSRGSNVIHANWSLASAATAIGQRWHKLPFVTTVHGSDIDVATRIPFLRATTRNALSRAARVIAPSHSLEDGVARLGIPRTRLTVVPNGVDTSFFAPGKSPREPAVLFVGALTRSKGVEFLLRSVPNVIRQAPSCYAVVVGDGPEEQNLRKLAGLLGIETNVRFAGALTQLEVKRWMQRAQVMVLPSLNEGLGVVLLEALACGLPCVGSRIGGIPDVITPEVGLLVPPGRPSDLAAAILAILADPQAYHQMSTRARDRALRHYAWPSVAKRLADVYAAAVGGHDP